MFLKTFGAAAWRVRAETCCDHRPHRCCFMARRLLVVLIYIALYFSISIRNYFWHIYLYLKTDGHAHTTLLKPLPRILESFCRVSVCVHVWVCVSSSRSKALLLMATWGLPSFTLSSLPTPRSFRCPLACYSPLYN